jgi:hypothetical protein
MRALSIGECKCQEWRTIRGGGVYIGLKNLAVGLRCKIQTKSGGRQTLFSWRSLFMDGFEKDLESLDSIIFTSSNIPFLIVWCSYS